MPSARDDEDVRHLFDSTLTPELLKLEGVENPGIKPATDSATCEL